MWLCAHLDRRIVGMTENSEGKQIPIFFHFLCIES